VKAFIHNDNADEFMERVKDNARPFHRSQECFYWTSIVTKIII